MNGRSGFSFWRANSTTFGQALKFEKLLKFRIENSKKIKPTSNFEIKRLKNKNYSDFERRVVNLTHQLNQRMKLKLQHSTDVALRRQNWLKFSFVWMCLFALQTNQNVYVLSSKIRKNILNILFSIVWKNFKREKECECGKGKVRNKSHKIEKRNFVPFA
jgi:hypothetical protein